MSRFRLRLKDKFSLLYVLGALTILFIAGIGFYGIVKSIKDIEALYTGNYHIVNNIFHIKEDILMIRVELFTMLAEKDREKNLGHKRTIEYLSTDILNDYDNLLRDKRLNDHINTVLILKEGKEILDKFIYTRNNKLIPLILQNRFKEANKLVIGIQQQRYYDMMSLLNEAINLEEGYAEAEEEKIKGFARNLIITIIILITISLIPGTFIILSISRKILNRINLLASATKEVKKGVLDQRIEVGGDDELSELASDFNTMIRQLFEDRLAQEEYLRVMEWSTENMEKKNRELEAKNEELIDLNKRLQETQSHLIQAEKMSSIGQLAAGIAHEINNPTGFVSSNLKTLEGYLKDIKSLLTEYEAISKLCEKVSDEDLLNALKKIEEEKKAIDISFLLKDIDEIIHEAQDGMIRISKIVKDLREFSHAGSDKPEYADINKGLESTLNIVWNELKYKAGVVTAYGDIPQVLCYPQQLNQVFMNILVNAAQAIRDKGDIRVKTFTENNHVVAEISDTGEGIPPENLSRIFEPFFTTKPVGKGTGLGLSIVYGIIKRHDGKIEVESEVGRGTTFTVRLPVVHPDKTSLYTSQSDQTLSSQGLQPS